MWHKLRRKRSSGRGKHEGIKRKGSKARGRAGLPMTTGVFVRLRRAQPARHPPLNRQASGNDTRTQSCAARVLERRCGPEGVPENVSPPSTCAETRSHEDRGPKTTSTQHGAAGTSVADTNTSNARLQLRHERRGRTWRAPPCKRAPSRGPASRPR
eukprot:scaffold152_cov383-Prasinococcus_capsulatus_cf.AAC.6